MGVGRMGKCKDCKHWDTKVFSWEMGYGHCRGIEDGEPYKPLPPAYTVGISAQDASAKLMTLPDFGCSLYERKESLPDRRPLRGKDGELTPEQAARYRQKQRVWERHNAGETYASIAHDLGVSKSAVANSAKRWERHMHHPNFQKFLERLNGNGA